MIKVLTKAEFRDGFSCSRVGKDIQLGSIEEFKKEYQGVFESMIDDGRSCISIDKNGNIKHIPNSEIFMEK